MEALAGASFSFFFFYYSDIGADLRHSAYLYPKCVKENMSNKYFWFGRGTGRHFNVINYFKTILGSDQSFNIVGSTIVDGKLHYVRVMQSHRDFDKIEEASKEQTVFYDVRSINKKQDIKLDDGDNVSLSNWCMAISRKIVTAPNGVRFMESSYSNAPRLVNLADERGNIRFSQEMLWEIADNSDQDTYENNVEWCRKQITEFVLTKCQAHAAHLKATGYHQAAASAIRKVESDAYEVEAEWEG